MNVESLQKREIFCVKLRKEKKALILAEKRKKLCLFDDQLLSGISNELDLSDPNYE